MKQFYQGFLPKNGHRNIALLGLFCLCISLSGCRESIPKYGLSWQKSFQTLGTSSSIRCVDLTGDGTLDVVLGAGRVEFQASDSAVLALDGKNGEVLWAVEGKDQMVGSASFLDISQDGIPDVIIGGRSAEFKAINGKTGEILWSFVPKKGVSKVQDYLRFNFYNAQIIPDQDGDNLEDILIVNGGNVNARMHSDEGRFPGVLAIFSSLDGKLIAADTMPDAKETYLSPLIHQFAGDAEPSIIFGSGGETRSGSLYITSLSALLNNDISNARVLYTESEQGFIAPPILLDLQGDGRREIVAISHKGNLFSFDSSTDSLLWTIELPGYEANNSPCPGFFNKDDIPDIFISVSKGVWPENTGQKQLAIDGRNGKILWEEELGCCGFSSPLSYDLDGDDEHELVWSINEYNCEGIYLAGGSHYLYMKDLGNAREEIMTPKVFGKNIGTTPWLGDLDQDGFLDILYCVQANTTVIHQYFGIQIIRSNTSIPVSSKPAWTEYMGKEGKGIF